METWECYELNTVYLKSKLYENSSMLWIKYVPEIETFCKLEYVIMNIMICMVTEILVFTTILTHKEFG